MRPTTKSLIAAAFLVGLSAQAQAQTVRLTAVLSGGQEAPTQILTGATGTGEVFVNMATREVTYTVRVFNLPSGTTAGHFHVGRVGRRRPGGGRSGAAAEHLQRLRPDRHGHAARCVPNAEQGIRDWDDFIQSLVGGQTYLNIHTAVNPGGEIRGQLTVTP